MNRYSFAKKAFLLTTILFTLQYLLVWFVLPAMPIAHSQPDIRLDKLFLQPLDILYLGDSTLVETHPRDTNRQSIPAMLNDHYPNLSIAMFSQGAYQMDMYNALVKYICARNYTTDLIIIPINMRTFSPAWDLRPEWQFERDKRELEYGQYLLLKPFSHLLISLGPPLDTISKKTFSEATIEFRGSPVGKVSYFESLLCQQPNNERSKQIFIYHYLYGLSKDHRKVQSLINLVELANNNNVKMLFYFTPIDRQSGYTYVGPEFDQILDDNIQTLVTMIYGENVNYIDLSDTLVSADFSWKRYPNEHLKESGRLKVAAALADAINTWLAASFP